ncbi:MAG TPA: YcnI family protein [Actinoplanes sp.]|nr:YcnI family protein [Actinoplanes sp.]
MSLWKRTTVVAGTVAALTLTIAAPAAAHVSVSSPGATQGGYSTVTFKVPNESDEASTTKLEVTLPADAPVASVSLRPVPGWTAVAEKASLATPLEVHGRQITEAVSKITWTASGAAAIKPGQFQAFDVSMGPLPEAPQMIFKALQTYSDGTVVRWIDEPATDGTEPESPAPVLTLAAADAPAAGDPAATASDAAPAGESDNSLGTTFGLIGAGLGLVALILALLAYRRAGRPASTGAAIEKETVTAGKAG